MKKIGYKNFRKFESFPVLELGKVNLLVGGNNAGKSTFVKAALLIYNFIHTRISDLEKGSEFGSLTPEMYFDVVSPYDVHIGTFYRAKKHNSDIDSPIEFMFDVNQFSIKVKVYGNIVDGNLDKNAVSGKVGYLSIIDNTSNVKYIVDYSTHRMCVEFKKTILSNDDMISVDMALRQQYERELAEETNFAKIIELKSKITEISNRLQAWEYSNSLEDIVIDLPLCDFIDTPSDYYLTNVVKSFCEYADIAPSSTLNKNSKEYKKELSDKNLLKSKQTIMLNTMRNLLFAISQTDVEYIYAHAARQVVFFNSKDKNDYMAQTIHDFTSSKAIHNEKSTEFIKHWMGKDGFMIGNDYKIEEHGGEAYEVSIINGNSETPLADMGMGSIQMMILLLRLATFIKTYSARTYPPTIIIEEPEQNLHPALQSKLAEMFAYLSEKYNFSFIVETHSEYLVRNTQVLVANSKYTDEEANTLNPFKVYYFPSNTERKPYSMIYRKDGNFQNEFEPGFFDAANELLFAIL